MTVRTFAAESVVRMVSHYIDSESEDYSVEAAISKVIASESLWQSAYDALQIAGGTGFMRDYPYERLVRDARINNIFEGTNEILRLYIALSGAKEAGRYLKEVSTGLNEVFNDPIESLGLLSGYAARKFTHLTSLGRETIDGLPKSLETESRILEAATPAFASAVESMVKKHKKSIIDQQMVLKRLADVAIDLFTGFCVVSRTASLIEGGSGENSPENDIATLYLQSSKRRINQNLRRLERNEDEITSRLAKTIAGREGRMWDII
jgi:alkylation response protein AidB-like acyl-CoA dehydrogenase